MFCSFLRKNYNPSEQGVVLALEVEAYLNVRNDISE